MDAPIELLTDPVWKPDRGAGIQMFLSVPDITSKEQLLRELKNLTLALIVERFPHNVWAHVHTDVSAEEGMKNDGSGVYMSNPDGDTTSLSVPGGPQCSSYRAEILAICTAAEHLLESEKQMGNVAIFTDSLSTLQVFNSADQDQMIQGLHSSLNKLAAQHSVSFQWVPAQVGLTGNERAGRFAKISSQIGTDPADHYLLPEHRALWSESPSEEDWRFRHFLCECGQADQTPDHILQSFPKYDARRQLTRPHGADLVTKLWGSAENLYRTLKLWGSAEDLYRTAGFVASTGLKI